jgi:DNA (cytosine-5)-methyltransferase 1
MLPLVAEVKRMSQPLTFGSLFTGIGGLDLGLERAGLHCAWQVEINEYAANLLAHRWPNVTRFRDVCHVGKANLSPVDILAGGFPCQDISLAGPGTGLDGERSGLWREFARLICELQPRYVIVENVAALRYRGLWRVLADLARSGYDAQWRVFQAASFGYPHERKRLFVVAYPHEDRRFRLDPYHAQGCSGLYPTQQTPETVVLLRDMVAQLEQRWRTPSVCRGDDGVPYWLERLESIGNAVVPDLAEHVGRCILAAQTWKERCVYGC